MFLDLLFSEIRQCAEKIEPANENSETEKAKEKKENEGNEILVKLRRTLIWETQMK